jgi:hypothetical protein
MRQGNAPVRRTGRKVEPSANGVNPGGVNMLGNMVGDHITGEKGGSTGFTGEKLYRGRGYEAPRNKSQSHGSGSQGRY